MPIYEYRCDACGDFDVMQRITDKPLRKCPTCKGKVTKLVSNTSFQLKGTGWYVTDYAGKGKKSDGASAKDGASTESSSNGKESKAEKKAAKGKSSGAVDAA